MVHVFDSEREYRPLKTLQDHSSVISAVKFANDGTKFFSSAGDKSLVLSHITNGRDISRFNSSTVSEGSIKDMDNDVSNKWILTCGRIKR
jgi:WD40 repeat protein